MREQKGKFRIMFLVVFADDLFVFSDRVSHDIEMWIDKVLACE